MAARETAGVSTPVVLYDGVCGLCNGFVQFVIARDDDARFRFAPLQGPFAAAVLARQGRTVSATPETILLVEDVGLPVERLLERSDAALAIVGALGGGWRLTRALRLVPRFLRDAVYAGVARIRYRVFGRLDACAVPSSAVRARFLD